MCTESYPNNHSQSSLFETCDSDSFDEGVAKLKENCTCNLLYPCRWDELPKNEHVSTSNSSPLKLVHKDFQPEYWWSRYSTDFKKGLKSCWLSYMDLRDERYSISEYQLIREIIWVLLGAKKCFILQLSKNQVLNICCRSRLVSVNHLTYNALDSLLHIFADWNDHILFIRVVVQYVVSKMDYVSHPCAFSFIDCLNKLLSKFDEFLHELEGKSRNPGIFTMISLYHCLIPWCNRIKMLSKVIRDVVDGNFDNLHKSSTITRLLDKLHRTADLLEDCSSDCYSVQMLRSIYIHTFHPFISLLFKFFSGSTSFTDPCIKLFVNINYDMPPSDPKFWFDAIKPKDDALDSPHIPLVVIPLIDSIVDGLKAVFLLTAICEKIGDYSFLEKAVLNPLDISLSMLLNERNAHFVFSHQESHASQVCCGFDEPEVNLKSLVSQLKHFVCKQRMLANRQLLELLLTPNLHNLNGLRTIGNCLTIAGEVYLFGAGDTMNDFARHCFTNVTFPRTRKLDIVDLTSTLQRHLNGTFRNHLVPHSLRYLESFFFTFDLNNSDHSPEYRSMHLNLDMISNLKLNYQVDWPANVILDEKCIGVYNGVFIFLLQIKFVKWSLENLHFNNLMKGVPICFTINHCLIVLRIKMLFIFASLHDFLVHRVEAIRIRFSSKWCLPACDSSTFIIRNIPETYSFSDLVQDHNRLLSELQSVCLLNESSSLLFTEIYNLCNMGLQLRELWSNNFSCSKCNTSRFKEEIETLSDQFDNHVLFLSTMLARSIRLSNVKQLLYLSSSFKIAAVFSTNIFKLVPFK
ncbi:hypothetical protein MN116_003016 [Schistosoma mekongi]|uniref:Gamma-tubulin complex component n=1 Tax=Schistosoma mekongi TaxID=38744 RepID=A0AAE2D6Y3_SCHME|nr:hypothetical protein MN116_003016 [Schistosoma mekongi]